jgi:hypothetical protein
VPYYGLLIGSESRILGYPRSFERSQVPRLRIFNKRLVHGCQSPMYRTVGRGEHYERDLATLNRVSLSSLVLTVQFCGFSQIIHRSNNSGRTFEISYCYDYHIAGFLQTTL